MEWTALLLGLGGGLHCAGMCGPLVLALPGPRAPGALLRRVCYQLGRVITYALLGAAAGSLGKSLTVFGIGRWVSLAAGFSIAIGVLWSQRMGGGVWWIRQLGQWRQRVVPYLRPTSVGAFAVFGAFNGLLPCGLVYVACAAASASGGILAGAGYMIWFGLGTMPILLGLSLSQRALSPAIRLRLRAFSPVSIGLVSVLFILRGLALGIPYLSPAIGAACPNCH